jgi:hypothetical protein
MHGQATTDRVGLLALPSATALRTALCGMMRWQYEPFPARFFSNRDDDHHPERKLVT